ncbi:hypothetical protein [uncultured Ruminococcus sp.]|uniref:hypothetical protein n=1 Tax=uncultured Ruminococcus sp. TaxID=165186 RepID=UPI0026353FF1|nr:hypothetical protein [uncultured Ruminococcus sp.]
MNYRCEEKYNEEFENVKSIVLGSGRFYYIYRDDKPYVKIEVRLFDFFSDTVFFHNYFVIGNYYEGIYAINMLDLEVKHKEISGYFGHYEIIDDNLYVLGMNNITAFDSCMNEKWISENIAIDGVTFYKTEGDTMVVSCEMDPPDGWITKRISLSDGKLI